MSMCSVCNFEVSVDRVTCGGLCGKLFHPLCTGVSKRLNSYMSEITSRFVFYCDECKQISLAHILLAIQCNNKSLSSSISGLTEKCRKIGQEQYKIDDAIKLTDDLHSEVLNLNSVIKSNTKIVNKQFCDVTNALNDLSTLKSEIFNEIYGFRDSLNKIKSVDSLREDLGTSAKILYSIRSDLDVLQQSSSRPTAHLESSHLLVLSEVIANVSNFASELSTIRGTIEDLTEVVKISMVPQRQNNTLLQPPSSNKSLLEEISEATSFNTTDLSATTSPITTTTTNNVSSLKNPKQVLKFGTIWTEDEWNNRITKLDRSNIFELFFKNTPRSASKTWIREFFLKNYAISDVECKRISSTSFKVSIPGRYGWLFTSLYRTVKIGAMSLSQWTIKPPKKTASLKQPPKNIVEPERNCRKNHRTTTGPNWTFKTNVFADFSMPAISAIQSKIALKRKPQQSPPKPPPKRISTNCSPPSSSTNASTLSNVPPQYHNKISTKKVSFNLSPSLNNKIETTKPTIPNNYHPNFVYSHTLKPSTSSDARKELPEVINPLSSHKNANSYLNPLAPPAAKLTKHLSDSSTEDRYVISRLRDQKIFNIVRLYLAYLHDKPDSVCYEGKTNTNVKVQIAQEGLPVERKELLHIFEKFHESLSISPSQVTKDLSSYGSYISSKRISYLQRSRNDRNRYFRP